MPTSPARLAGLVVPSSVDLSVISRVLDDLYIAVDIESDRDPQRASIELVGGLRLRETPSLETRVQRRGCTVHVSDVSRARVPVDAYCCVCFAVYLDSASDRKSTRLNSSHPSISYAVFCLKKK